MKKISTLLAGALALGTLTASADPVLYINNQCGYEATYVYMWGDINDLGGGWPGIAPSGTLEKDGVVYDKFEIPASGIGKYENIIYNNGVGAQLSDYAITFEDAEYFLDAYPTGLTIAGGDAPVVEYVNLYVKDNTGWGSLYIYAWGSKEVLGTWPGSAPAETVTIAGEEYLKYNMEKNPGTVNLIFNNNNGTQFDGPEVSANADLYFSVTADSYEILPVPGVETHYLYIENNSNWNPLYVYAYGDAEIFGNWPGSTASETVEVDGVNYLVFPVEGTVTVNLIFNSGVSGEQYDAFAVTTDKDYYINAGVDSAEEVGGNTPVDPVDPIDPVDPELPDYYIYVDNQTGWDALHIYAWTEEYGPTFFGSWPGYTTTETTEVDNVTYLAFPVYGQGHQANLIFHNNNGSQYDAISVNMNKNYYIKAEPDKAVELDVVAVSTIAVENFAPVYYNLQGFRVNAPEKGKMYIVVKGNETSKVIF